MEKETPTVDDERNRFLALTELCNKKESNEAARQKLKQMLKQPECGPWFMEKQQGIYHIAIGVRVELFTITDLGKEVIYAKCSQLRQELGYQAASPLERLAIEQIVLCHLNYHQTELEHASATESGTREQAIHWERRLSFAARRYNHALETLGRMRRLKLVLQVNNANNQIVSN